MDDFHLHGVNDDESGPEHVILSDWEPLLLDHEREAADPHFHETA